MKLFKYLVPLIAVMGFVTVSPLAAHGGHGGGHGGHDHASHDHNNDDDDDRTRLDQPIRGGGEAGQDRSTYLEQLNERDWSALRDYIAAKRTDKDNKDDKDDDDEEENCDLTISGDVRTEWRHLNEWGLDEKGVFRRLRGGDATKDGIRVSRDDFDIEFNVRFDYVCERTWAVAHLDFDNSAGAFFNDKSCKCDPEGFRGSGSENSVCLKKAYVGYNVFECGDRRFDVELGRRNLYNVFDSQVQFLNRFDGLTLKYSEKSELGDFYWNFAGFVIDERANHYGYVTELGILDIMDSKIDLKYSFIDWERRGKNRCDEKDPRGCQFQVSQWTMAYHFDKEVLKRPAKLYGAFLMNHSNVRIKLPTKTTPASCPQEWKKTIRGEPFAWYVGFVYGEVVDEGDFAASIQYEWVEATAIPDSDVSGIGRGNILNDKFTVNGRGNTNYKGVKLEFLYGLTTNLSLDMIIEWSSAINRHIGGKHYYSKFELESIYAF